MALFRMLDSIFEIAVSFRQERYDETCTTGCALGSVNGTKNDCVADLELVRHGTVS